MRILLYHQIVESTPPNIHAVQACEFARQLDWLRTSVYQTVHLDDYLENKEHGTTEKTVAITFDDGYQDFLTNALPMLREYGYGATVFLIAGLMGKPRTWHDGDDTSTPPLLTWSEARELKQQNIGIGSHTLTHPDLTTIPLSDVENELRESQELLEQEIGAPIKTFSYPFSRENLRVRQIVKESGYRLACTCPTGYVGAAGRNPYKLERVTILATDTIIDFEQKVNGSFQRRIARSSRFLREQIKQQLKHSV